MFLLNCYEKLKSNLNLALNNALHNYTLHPELHCFLNGKVPTFFFSYFDVAFLGFSEFVKL